MTVRDDIRIGDAEREQVVTQLREHFAQGRLTDEEFNERLDAAYAAKTGGDLKVLTRDLPGPGGRVVTQSGRPVAYGRSSPFRVLRLCLLAFAVFVIGGAIFGPAHRPGSTSHIVGWDWSLFGFGFGRIVVLIAIVAFIAGRARRRRWNRDRW